MSPILPRLKSTRNTKHGGLEQQICFITTSNTDFKEDVIQLPNKCGDCGEVTTAVQTTM